MYGYIRPCRSELRVREAQSYSAAYCGLCHALGKRCGLFSRFTVSYDLTLLAMLLSDGEEKSCSRRCLRHPLRKKRCYCGGGGAARAADYGMILYWWKIQDARRDEKGWKRLGASLAALFLRRGYRAAATREKEFDSFTRERLDELAELEAQKCAVPDAPADCFARILERCGETGDEMRSRCLRELLYHVGRVIYYLDAADDLPTDREEGSYNPLLLRYESWGEREKDAVRGTLNLSLRRAEAALSLLPEDRYTPIVENILAEGIPLITELVLRGEWKNRNKHLRKYNESLGSEEL